MRTDILLVIPAAGFGSRMKKIARGRPKELLPLAGCPAIAYALAEGLDAGLTDAAVVIRAGKEDLRRVLEDDATARRVFPAAAEALERLRTRLNLTFLYQREPRGEADALLCARELADGRDLAVIYPDNLHLPGPGALRALLAARSPEARNLCALAAVPPALEKCVSNSGRVDLLEPTGGLLPIRRFLPKGQGRFVPRAPGELRTCGIYLTTDGFLAAAELAAGLYPHAELTDGKVRRLMQALGDRFFGLRLPGVVHDLGNPEGYRACRRALGDRG